jgi:phage replication-related protein YjqB (UPF0714/DUF867 family)
MLRQLLATEGVREQWVKRSSFGFCALHGGLEAATAEIASAAALASGASFYAVVQPDDVYWHVPSHRYDPTESSVLQRFLAHVDVVISVHGFGGVRGADDRWTTALLGGSNRALAEALQKTLSHSLPGYRWIADIDVIPRHLRGLHPANPVNLARSGGVQLELPPRVRRPGVHYDTLVTTLSSVAVNAQRRYSDATPPVAPASRPLH